MQLSPEQLKARAGGLGASEIPAILGLGDRNDEFKVWLSKAVWLPNYEELNRQESSAVKDRGHFAEDMIAKMYERDHEGQRPQVFQQTLTHPRYHWLFATPDYVSHDSNGTFRGFVECKTTAKFLDEEHCPEAYEAQARAQMACAGLGPVTVAALNGGGFIKGAPNYYLIERNDETEKKIIEVAEHWWNKHVIERIEPEPDSSDEYARYCNLQPSKGKILEVEDDHPLAQLILKYHAKKTICKGADEDAALTANELKHAMIELDAVKGSFGTMWYKERKGSESTQWEQIARHLASEMAAAAGVHEAIVVKNFENLVKQYTIQKPAYRALNPKLKIGGE